MSEHETPITEAVAQAMAERALAHLNSNISGSEVGVADTPEAECCVFARYALRLARHVRAALPVPPAPSAAAIRTARLWIPDAALARGCVTAVLEAQRLAGCPASEGPQKETP